MQRIFSIRNVPVEYVGEDTAEGLGLRPDGQVAVGGQALRLLNTVLHDLPDTLVVHTTNHTAHLG